MQLLLIQGSHFEIIESLNNRLLHLQCHSLKVIMFCDKNLTVKWRREIAPVTSWDGKKKIILGDIENSSFKIQGDVRIPTSIPDQLMGLCDEIHHTVPSYLVSIHCDLNQHMRFTVESSSEANQLNVTDGIYRGKNIWIGETGRKNWRKVRGKETYERMRLWKGKAKSVIMTICLVC